MEHSKKYRLMANKLIRTLPEFADIKAAKVKIAYLSSLVYEPNVVGFSEKQMETLLRHELHHVGIDFEKDETGFYVVPHDVEEFWDIIDDV